MPIANTDLKAAVRKRIISHWVNEDFILFENKLATEFGVSRTPIRQVMQALSAEGLVEIRSGVGTIATPLLDENEIEDLKSYSAILKACAECMDGSVQSYAAMEFSTIEQHLQLENHTDLSALFFDSSLRFADVMSGLISDKVLRTAFIACYWRFVRRRVRTLEGQYKSIIRDFDKVVKDAVYGAQTGDPEKIFRMVSGNVHDIINAKAA